MRGGRKAGRHRAGKGKGARVHIVSFGLGEGYGGGHVLGKDNIAEKRLR